MNKNFAKSLKLTPLNIEHRTSTNEMSDHPCRSHVMMLVLRLRTFSVFIYRGVITVLPYFIVHPFISPTYCLATVSLHFYSRRFIIMTVV